MRDSVSVRISGGFGNIKLQINRDTRPGRQVQKKETGLGQSPVCGFDLVLVYKQRTIPL